MSINIDVVEEILLFQHVLDKKVSIQDFKVAILRHVYERYKMRKMFTVQQYGCALNCLITKYK